ncbi:MAG: GNAT family N-acetyltransferase [Phycisphaera sp. RhM]|nr:GNAT family N-acetyltransferase [Phycisphaera sp. RhM]
MKSYTTGPETTRLNHRAFTLDDASEFFALNGNPDVMQLTGEPVLTSLDAAREAIANYSDFDDLGFGRWACILKQTRTIIGFCGLKYLPELDAVDVGYRFHPEYWGHGFATEACAASLDFGFETICLDKILGFVLPKNVASIRVLEKVGMQPDGEVMYDGLLALRFVKRASRICEPADAREPPT